MIAAARRLAPLWTGRSPRERLMLGGLGIAAALYLAVTAGAQPLLAARSEARAAIAASDAVLARLAALPEGDAALIPATLRPAVAIVTETAPDFDLAIRRIEPEGAGARLVIEDADFAAVLLWIEALERDHGLRLVALEMDRRPEPGVVSARLTLER